MGIKSLSKFIKTYAPNCIVKITYKDLENKTIAFDTSILIYQFVIAIRGTGSDLTNASGDITSHIHAIVTKTLGYLRKKINPVFVFDGKAPRMKSETLKKRSKIKTLAKDILASKIELPKEDTIKLLKKSFSITSKQIKEIKEILHLVGIPIIEAFHEADSECAFLQKTNLVDYVASDDLDILTFGANKLIRFIGNEKKMVMINKDILLKDLKLTHEQFVDLCIMLGCDYCPKINKIGMKKAYELILKYGTIENIIKNYSRIQSGNIEVNQIFIDNYQIIREYFLNPPLTPIDPKNIKWKKPAYNNLREKLINDYSYQEKYINKVLFKHLQYGYYKTLVLNN